MITKTLQKKIWKKKFNSPGWVGFDKKIKKGRGEARFHSIFPHFLQNSPKAPQDPWKPPFLHQLQAFSAYLSQLFLHSTHPTQVSAIHLYLFLLLPCGIWCFICCFLCNICEISYVQTHDQKAWIGGGNGWL